MLRVLILTDSSSSVAKHPSIVGWKTFGHPGATRLLTKTFEANRLAHAYLITGPEKVGQPPRIPTIGFDARSRLHRHQRWGDHHAVDSFLRQKSLQPKAGRPGFITDSQIGIFRQLPQLLQQATEIAAKRGRICMVGGHSASLPLHERYARSKELTISWSFCYGRRDGRKELQLAIDLLAAGKLNPDPLITHQFPLDQVIQAFDVAAGREEYGSIKVLVLP